MNDEAPSNLRQSRQAGHELRDVPVRRVLLVVGGLTLVTAVLLGALVGFFQLLAASRPAEPPRRIGKSTIEAELPEPQLQESPAEELRQLRLWEESRLENYGWVDRDSGVAHIPIDQAMEALLEEGLPTAGPSGPSKSGKTRRDMIRQSRPNPEKATKGTQP